MSLIEYDEDLFVMRGWAIPKARVPKLVRHVAKEFAGQLYSNHDVLVPGQYRRTARFRREAGSEKAFVKAHWIEMVPFVFKTFCEQLRLGQMPEKELDEVYDAVLTMRGFQTDEGEIAPSIIRMN